jgi:hypothetical protein
VFQHKREKVAVSVHINSFLNLCTPILLKKEFNLNEFKGANCKVLADVTTLVNLALAEVYDFLFVIPTKLQSLLAIYTLFMLCVTS